jgi:hypothetical protein
VALLRELGAEHVLDSSAPSFQAELIAAMKTTGATLAFDAIGGGKLAGQILFAMETACVSTMTSFGRYGSPTHKQIYVYGALDLGPTEIPRAVGLAWSVSGFLLTYFLETLAPADVARMRTRVATELTTTFASHYAETLSLREMLDPTKVASYVKKGTGAKVLVDPTR